jgi:hypothetical protein
MAKVLNCFWGLLIICVSCHHRVPAPSVETTSADSGSNLINDSVPSATIVIEAPLLAQAEVPKVIVVTAKKVYPDITTVYLSQVGARELTGKNDGKQVEKYLRSVGLKKGYAWCAAFVRWCFDTAGIKTSINGAAASAHNPKDLVYFHGKQLKEPEPGDVFTLWFNSLGRIAHTGFYHARVNSSVYESVEGNTNEAGSREGDGVYKKYRSFKATYSISRWKQ